MARYNGEEIGGVKGEDADVIIAAIHRRDSLGRGGVRKSSAGTAMGLRVGLRANGEQRDMVGPKVPQLERARSKGGCKIAHGGGGGGVP